MRKSFLKKASLIVAGIVLIVSVFVAGACSGGGDAHPNIRITMEDGGIIDLELDKKAAPSTVENFLKLVNIEYYDGNSFESLVGGLAIITIEPEGQSSENPAALDNGGRSDSGVKNPISHEKGVISMARSAANDSASSQFFILTGDSKNLDATYTAFGHVTAGMDIVEKIASASSDEDDNTGASVKITSITVVEKS